LTNKFPDDAEKIKDVKRDGNESDDTYGEIVMLDALGFSNGIANNCYSGEKEAHNNCHWIRVCHLHDFPPECVTVYWNPRKRAIVIKAKAFHLQKSFEHEVEGLHLIDYSNASSLVAEKRMHCMSQTISLPKEACAKKINAIFDERNSIVVLCAEIPLLENFDRKECGSDPLLGHQWCQPEEKIHSKGMCRAKIISEDDDWLKASMCIREQILTQKRVSFPGVMKSPFFVKDTSSWHLCIQFKLPTYGMTEKDVEVNVNSENRVLEVSMNKEEVGAFDEDAVDCVQVQPKCCSKFVYSKAIKLPSHVDCDHTHWKMHRNRNLLSVLLKCENVTL
jgi:HSP20 family molecular chaperone IbpA